MYEILKLFIFQTNDHQNSIAHYKRLNINHIWIKCYFQVMWFKLLDIVHSTDSKNFFISDFFCNNKLGTPPVLRESKYKWQIKDFIKIMSQVCYSTTTINFCTTLIVYKSYRSLCPELSLHIIYNLYCTITYIWLYL